MYSKNVIIELDKIDTIVHWENLSDIHIGNANFQEDLFVRRVNAILDDPYRFTSFGGDQLDLILPGDPRFKDEAVTGRTLAEQQEEFDDYCAPLFEDHDYYLKNYGMEKIWYMQWGNHEYKSRVVTEGDMKRYTKHRNMTFLGSKGFVRLDIRFKDKSLMKKTLFVNHGAGGGTTLKALENLTINCEADVYQMGHLHDPMGIKRDTFYFNDKKGAWDTKEQILVNSGCFTTAVRNNVDQWMEQKGNKLMTSKPGTWTISFDAYNGKVNSHG
jgi:hypothetical protein